MANRDLKRYGLSGRETSSGLCVFEVRVNEVADRRRLIPSTPTTQISQSGICVAVVSRQGFVAAFTIATIPARMASGSVNHAAT